ncbi:putative nucleic acid-binding Zn ribbon protein [Kitasatospora sp. MAP12-15]|uniref:DUF721 domain-containing protein n=1 Tax=unclassified Kitasatospora TaxID=2633591 RepID=UPI0024765DBB|nr:DUF721 domain-containing protein [Kitasatospora sp. MAP12-44]MDH6107868.1 putative nucleic acid-binding Zn ribbon protein [Kitasatospora sp. MAP12-44]
MTETSTGVDIARVALKAAQDAARARGADAPGGRSSTTRPTRRRTVRASGREPISFSDALAGLVAERAWEEPAAGGSILDQWTAIAPELIGKVTPTHYDPHTGRLHLQPSSPAYATQLRLLGRQLVARINGAMGRVVVRELRVLPPRAVSATGPDQQSEHRAAVEQPDVPARTREDACDGYRRALAAHQAAQRTAAITNPAVTAAIARQEQALLSRREPESAFTDAVAVQAEQEERAARTAAATSSQAIAERRAIADKAERAAQAERAGTVPLRPARQPMTLSGAA